jgi:dienelactone hydrolase
VAVVLREVERVGAANVYLGGISMGMMMAFHVLMDPRLPALGGFVGIVGEMLNETRVRATRRHVPIRCFFADNDDYVPPAAGRKSLRRLKAQGFDVADLTIPGSHGSLAVEKYALGDFFHELIPEAAPRRLFRDLIPEAARRRLK